MVTMFLLFPTDEKQGFGFACPACLGLGLIQAMEELYARPALYGTVFYLVTYTIVYSIVPFVIVSIFHLVSLPRRMKESASGGKTERSRNGNLAAWPNKFLKT